jgi:AraC-like DNA-binding protein
MNPSAAESTKGEGIPHNCEMSSDHIPSPRPGATDSAPPAPDGLASVRPALSHDQTLAPVLTAADELAGYLDTDQMLRRAVELARERIGLERVGLYVRDPRAPRPLLRGTWGTGIRRETVDEHNLAHEYDPRSAEQLCNLQLQGALWQHHESMLQCPQGVDGSTDLGLGWLVKTPLIAGRQLVGVMYNDTALSGTLLDELQQVRNAVLCTLLAGLFFQRRGHFPWQRITHRRSAWLVRVLRELEENPGVTGEHLAHQLSISPGHLGRSFKTEMGLSLVDYRNQRLLDRFLSAVQRGDGSLLAAALEAGFGSYTQFHRVYKRAFGESPRTHLSARQLTPASAPARESTRQRTVEKRRRKRRLV